MQRQGGVEGRPVGDYEGKESRLLLFFGRHGDLTTANFPHWVYTGQGINVERITYDEEFWNGTLLPKLTSFYDDCVAPEIVSPVHSLGLPIRDMSKQS